MNGKTPDLKRNLLESDFIGTGIGTAGKSASFQAKYKGNTYQVKSSSSIKFARKVSGYDRDSADIIGEFIASKIAEAMIPPKDGVIRTPEVFLVEGKNDKLMLASKYLEGAQTLDDAIGSEKGKHAHLDFTQSIKDKSGVTIRKEEIAEMIYTSMILGDHDVNPGNMMVLTNMHVGRIDYGHAFNDLIKRWGINAGKEIKSEGILDYLNKSSLNLNQESKIRRDYTGIFLDDGFISKLENSDSDLPNINNGINEAVVCILTFIDQCQNKDIIRDVKNSLETLGIRVNSEIAIDSEKEAKDSNFASKLPSVPIDRFKENSMKSMAGFQIAGVESFMTVTEEAKSVGNMLRIQKIIDDGLKKGEVIDCKELEKIWMKDNKYLAGEGFNKKVTWVRLDDEKEVFRGDLKEYIQNRSKVLGISSKALTKKLDTYQNDNPPAINTSNTSKLAIVGFSNLQLDAQSTQRARGRARANARASENPYKGRT